MEHAVWAEVAGGDGGHLPQECRDALLAAARARHYLSALMLAAPMELAGAVLAALAPHPAPGIVCVFAAQARCALRCFCCIRGCC